MNAVCALLLLFVEEAEAVAEGFKNRARGFTLARLELILKTTLKTTINKSSLRIQFGEGPENN